MSNLAIVLMCFSIFIFLIGSFSCIKDIKNNEDTSMDTIWIIVGGIGIFLCLIL
jgi:hypothetical protein